MTTAASLAAASVCAARADAVTDCFWTNPAGGTFNLIANWNNGAGPVAGSTNDAKFELASTYTVAFSNSPTNAGLALSAGNLSLVTNGSPRTYTVNSFATFSGSSTMSINGASAPLTLKGGWITLTGGSALTLAAGNHVTITQSAVTGLAIGLSTDNDTGSVSIDGTGTTLNSTSGGIQVGNSVNGVGALTASNYANVSMISLVDLRRGNVTFQSGADFTGTGNLTVGAIPGAAAALTVTDAGTTWIQGTGTTVKVGNGTNTNAASLAISNGAVFTVGDTNYATVGTATLQVDGGTLDFTGGTLNLKGTVTVSHGGTLKRTAAGTVNPYQQVSWNVTTGGTINLAGDLVLSTFEAINNYVNVQDAGSNFTVGGKLSADGAFVNVKTSGTLAAGGNLDVGVTNDASVTIDGSGAALNVGGNVAIGGGGSSFGGHLTLKNGASGNFSGNLTINQAASAPMDVQSGSHVTVGGNLNLVRNAITLGSSSTFTMSAGGVAVIGDGTHSTTFSGAIGSSLTIGSGGILVNPSATVFAGTVVLNGPARVNGTLGGRIDLTDQHMNLSTAGGYTGNAVGSWLGSSYTAVSGQIQTGRHGGAWNGDGIMTSEPAALSGLTSIGVATASQAKGIAATATALWAGQTVTGGDTLVMYTYAGDANLDGKINVDDYGRIDLNVNVGTRGWYNGDFNYDGKINVDDYGIIDFNVGIQGTPFSTTATLSAVPEPSMLFALTPLALLARRRRSTKRR